MEAELKRLAEQRKKNYLEMSQEIKVVSQKLKSLEAQKAEVTEAMTFSNEVLDVARDQIKRAKEMITNANLLLSKAEAGESS